MMEARLGGGEGECLEGFAEILCEVNNKFSVGQVVPQFFMLTGEIICGAR